MTEKIVEFAQNVSQDSGRSTMATQQYPVVSPSPPPDSNNLINDKQFIDDVKQLRDLRSYMIRRANICTAADMDFGCLNGFRFDEKGRSPTSEEYSALGDRIRAMYKDLPEEERRRFLHGQIPRSFTTLAGVFGFTAFASLAAAPLLKLLHLNPEITNLSVFVCFLFWVATLGGIGSIAFIGMNALAVQEDATFDITNNKLIVLRVALGALFALVLTLPFGYATFCLFVIEVFNDITKTPEITEPPSALALKSILLLLPFILGFSTGLVITILNQFVDAIQTFFGRRSSPPPAAK